MTTIPTDSTAGYAGQADYLAVQYESVTFEDVHREVLHLLPAPPARIVDIGAGSGRDAAALARRGYHVVAAEPTRELREAGMAIHREVDIEWLDDHLPNLAALTVRRDRFDVVMLTAVWMHLDIGERETAMAAVSSLLAPGGKLLMTLRQGPVPEGRRMFDVSSGETIDLARRHGLELVHDSRRGDMFGRGDVVWSHVAVRRPLAAG